MSKLISAVHAAITHSRAAWLSAAATAVITLSAGAASASADSLVYVKNGTVYVSQADGSQARAITSATNGWAWPSETDSGIIAVAGGLPRTDGSFNPSGGDEIYEFDQQRNPVTGPVATQGTYSTVSNPEYVSHFRVAPDNSNVAWTDTSGYASPDASWRNPNGSGTFSTANDSYGAPLPYSSPEWWGRGHLLITHDGSAWSGQAEYALYNLADGTSPGWANDNAIGSSGSYQLTVARSGMKWAVMTDDGPDNSGTIHNISITLETSSTPPNTNVTDTHCAITLPASEFATSHGSSLASMSFSSDGTILAWGEDNGVYEANVSNPNDCAAVTSSVHMVVSGGQMPFLGAAPLAPAKPFPNPGPTPQPKPGPTPGPTPFGCCGPNPGPTVGAPNTAITRVRVNKRAHAVTLAFRGSGGVGPLSFRCKLDRGRWTTCSSTKTYRLLKKGRHTFQVVAVDGRGKFDQTPATRRFTV